MNAGRHGREDSARHACPVVPQNCLCDLPPSTSSVSEPRGLHILQSRQFGQSVMPEVRGDNMSHDVSSVVPRTGVGPHEAPLSFFSLQPPRAPQEERSRRLAVLSSVPLNGSRQHTAGCQMRDFPLAAILRSTTNVAGSTRSGDVCYGSKAPAECPLAGEWGDSTGAAAPSAC